jgi:hypothetical protein
MRFEIPAPFVGREFWLNIDGEILTLDRDFDIKDGNVVLRTPSHSPILTSIILFTDE